MSARPVLEIRDLELLLALAERGSTVGAASSLHLAQSAVSRALAQAEERLGVRLFDRRARGLTPTAAGERLLHGAPRLIADLNELERLARSPAPAPTRVRLVCECYTAYRWLPSSLKALRERMPDLEVEIATEHTQQPVQGLLERQVDIALLTTAELPKAHAGHDLREAALFSDEIVFVVAALHPLAEKSKISREELQRELLITGRTPPAERAWFLRSVFGRSKPKLRFMPLPLTEAIIDSARAGLGVAVLSEWMANGYVPSADLRVLRLARGPLRRPWRIAYRRSATDTAQRLTAALLGSVPHLPASVGRASSA